MVIRTIRFLFICALAIMIGCATVTAVKESAPVLGNELLKEAIDQGAHYTVGYVVACHLVVEGAPRDEAVTAVMEFAEAREAAQGECGYGCQLDLAAWHKGAREGAKCTARHETGA